MITEFSIFIGKGNTKDLDHNLKPCVAEAFTAMCKSGKQNEDLGDQQLHNMRISKPYLRRYLAQRYNGRLANKICALFDWSVTPMDYHNFYK